MTEPHSSGSHAVRTSPRRHARRRAAQGLVTPRFGAPTLAVGVALALAAGAGAGSLVGRGSADVVLDATGVEAAQVQAAEVEAPALAAGSPSELLGADVREDREGAVARSAARDPLPDATPAAPVGIDPVAVDAAGLTFADRQAGLLATTVQDAADGELVVVAGSTPAPFPDRAVTTIRVEVEAGLPVDGALFAETVMATLNDPRGWGADGSVSFARTDGPADLRVVLASPDLVDELCAPLDTVGQYSCGTKGHAVLNHMRWVQANPEFPDKAQYRQYLVNHEVGHLLGHRHVECPAPGERAPLMQQQTVGVAPCQPNGWPFPDAA